jgi:hypothetical protein
MVNNRRKQMKVQVRGCNYTGHHFRQIACAYDGRTVDVTLIGSDQQIVKFVLDNFDWGGDAARFPTVAVLCSALSNDDALNAAGFDPTEYEVEDNEEHPQLILGQFDGAGGVVWIKDETGEELFEVGDLDYFADNKIIDLGEVDLDKIDNYAAEHGLNGYYDYVNQMVRKLVEEGNA